MKKTVLIFSFVLFTTFAFAEIQLTQEQFDNIELLNKELRAKHADFIGFSGSKDEMRIIGISEEQAIKDIAKVDLQKLITEKEEKEAEEQKVQEKIRKLAIDKLKEEGVVLKFVDK